MKKYIHIFAIASLLFTGCYDKLSEETQGNLQALKDQDIATVEQQVKNITASIGTIESLSTELVKYIDILQKVSAGLETDYDALTKTLESVKASLQSEIDGANAEMLSAYESAKSALESKIQEIDSVIKVLQEKQTDLDGRADALRKSLKEDYATTDWVNATFATLESQKLVVSDVENIKAHVDELAKSLEATEKEITDLLDEKLSELDAKADEDLSKAMEELTNSYKEAITKASEEVGAAFDEALKKAISDSEEKLKGWVSEQLDGYLTIAAAEGYIAAFNTLVGTVPQGKSIQSQIDELQASLTKAKEDLTTAYEAAIEAAINKSASDMGEAITTEIKKIVGEIETLTGRVAALETEVLNLGKKLGELQGKINTIDGQIAAINTSLAVLEGFQGSLQNYIESVKSALENNDTEKYNETKALIDALQAAADAVQKEINSLKEYVGTLPAGASETDVVTWAANTMETVNKQFESYQKISDIESIKAGIDNLIGEQTGLISDYSTTLSTLIDDAKDTIDGWIDEDLKAYHTAAEIGTAISSLEGTLKNLIDAADSDVQTSLNTLKSDYETAVSEFIAEYKAAIGKAITDNQGVVDTKFTNAVNEAAGIVTELKTRVQNMETDITALETAIATIKTDVATITTGIGEIETFIKESGYTSLQLFVDYVNGEIDGCSELFATIAQFETLQEIIYGKDGTGETSGLKYWVDQMTDLTTKLGTAETEASQLADFFAGFGENETLEGELAKLNALLDELKEEVYGEDDVPGLQAMIDGILTALYGGKDKDRGTATATSICGLLKQLTDDTLASMFHSITYVPKTADGSVKAGTVTLEFIVEPAGLVALLDKDNCSLTSGEEITSISGDPDTGILTVTATVSKGWIALRVEVNDSKAKDGDGKTYPLEFISQYIRVN